LANKGSWDVYGRRLDRLEYPRLKGDVTMVPLTRILTLTAVGALTALTATSFARAEEARRHQQPILATVSQADLQIDCHLKRRAISRRDCQARVWREMKIDTAENK